MSVSKGYYASSLFTKDDIPVGSIIEVASGWRYRPEGWIDVGPQSSRPGTVSTSQVIVTEDWWKKGDDEYLYRAFNLSKTDGSSLVDVTAEEIDAAFTVWIPNS